MPEVEYDPITLTLIIVYNAVVFGMMIKWFIPELRRIRRRLRE